MRADGRSSSLEPALGRAYRHSRGIFWTYLPFVLGLPVLLAMALWALPWYGERWSEGVLRLGTFVAAGLAVIAAGEFCGRRGLGIRIQQQESELDRLQRHLRRSERRFEAILNQSAIGIAVAGMDGRLLIANEHLCAMLGYTCEQLRYKSYRELTDPADLPADDAQAQRLMAGEIDSYALEKRFVRRDGSSLWTHLTCSAVRSDVDYVIAIIQDISEQRRAQDALRESEAKFRSLAENARAAIGIVQGSRIVYANRYFAEISGYSTSELMSMKFPQLIHPRFRGMVMQLARRRQLGEAVPSTYEFQMVTSSGETRWIDFSAASIELNGMPAVIGAGFDITERKQVEDSLRASETRLVEAKDTAEAANHAKDQFLAVLSHELRTPLTPVLASASALRHELTESAETRESLAMICRNVELEARLIDDLLDLTRLSHGKLELKPQFVQVAVVLRHTVEICANEMAAKGLQLHVDLGRGDWWLRADPPRLQQVFWNLLNNAIKFTPTGGQVTITAKDAYEDANQVAIEVSDTGVGIAPDVLPRIFGAFEQGSRLVTQKFGGLGLGLAISKAVVELHGGTITALSEGIGIGATFRVVLPTTTPPSPQETRTTTKAAPTTRRPARILLVEDHADTARVMSRLLRASGHMVGTADSVATGFDAATREHFDLLISDLGLPDGSGLELMRRLRAEQHDIKGIALSGFGMEEDMVRSRTAGFSEHLTKPVSFDQLEEIIARVLQKGPDGNPVRP